MVTCPSCGSSRIRNDYKPAPITLRVVGIRALLCDNCNYQFRAFSPFPPKARRHRTSTRKNASLNSAESIELNQQNFNLLPTERRDPVLALPLSAKNNHPIQQMQVGVVVATAQRHPGITIDQIAPVRQNLRTEITKLYIHKTDTEASAEPSRESYKAEHSSTLTCPECGSHNIKRRKRNFLEKTFLSLTDHKPYVCRKCDASFYSKSVEQD